VGYANGGTVPNRVPHYAEAVGEMRAFESEVFDAGVKSLHALENAIHVSSRTGSACRVSIDVFETMQPWPLNPATEDLLRVWSQAAEGLGYRIIPEARGGLSDGNHIWNAVPTLDGLGPSGGNSHCSEHRPELGKEQEFLFLPSLVPKAVLNVAAIKLMVEG
jgi:glutamate carboxypeptidase